MKKWFQILYWSIRFKRIFPFLIFTDSFITIKSVSNFIILHRIRFGNSKKSPKISALPINFYAGFHSKLVIGHSVCIGPGVNIVVKDHAQLEVGSNTYFTSDSHIESIKEIKIGSNCAISWGVTIIDHNHHEIRYEGKGEERMKVSIGDHVWIGCNTVILPGTQIGSHTVVAAGSVVKGEFPDRCLIGGNPAQIIKRNVDWK